MSSHYYIKAKPKTKKRKFFRMVGFAMMAIGTLLMFFIVFPLISWYSYITPSEISLVAPVPDEEWNRSLLGNFFTSSLQSVFDKTDFDDAKNWFSKGQAENLAPSVSSYVLSIPKLAISQAYVSTVDTKLSEHLVHYPGTILPPNLGNAVIFGHSTLPIFFNQKNYKTIFANLYKLKKGDSIVVSIDNVSYNYVVDRIAITEGVNKTILTKRQNGNFLTLITCTPPGTKLKRLIVQSSLQAIEKV